ncbi:hypothetical protein BJY52DRAFT_1192840 [Lactarius psammicola]|nr:hypothetical protein BJY52DRAFT_1192840 [Lactarius psammicola]
MEQNNPHPSLPQHVPWSPDPIPPTPTINPNDTGHLLAHIKTFDKDPVPSQPYQEIMDAGFDPNTPPAPEITHHTQYRVRDDHHWLLSSSPMEPVGLAERQGTAPNRYHVLPPIETLAPLPKASFESLQSSVQYTQPSVVEVPAADVTVCAGLSKNMKRFIREATANLREICTANIPNRLPEEMRQIIRAAVEDGSTIETGLSRLGFTQEFRGQFPDLKIQDFIESINDALCTPVLTELRVPTGDPGWEDVEGEIECIRNELMVELGRDVSESQTGYAQYHLRSPLRLHRDSDFPASVDRFNLSVTLVLAALDCGVEDTQGDLEQAGLIPSSWFRLASAALGAILRGALRSGGRKVQGRVCITNDDKDEWLIAEGLAAPVTQGGRIATQAQQLANFFIHYAGTEEPPLMEFYNSVMHVGQNHIEKVVRLKAAATYQISALDVQGLTDMVLEDMSKQLYTHMVTDETARKRTNQLALDRLFIEAQQQLGPFMTEWKALYKHHLIQALKDDEEAREEGPPILDPLLQENEGYIKLFAYNRSKEIRKSIACTVTDPILDGDEITRARERIRLDHAEEIEAARRETRAQISSKKKAWAVAFHNLNKLSWLTKAVEEMGYVLVSKDDAEEREGCVPATPENRPRLLDNSQTPKARKTKGKHLSYATNAPDITMEDIKKPLFFASSYPETAAALQTATSRLAEEVNRITGISVPQVLVEPDTDVSVYAASRQQLLAPAPLPSAPTPPAPSRALTPDSTRGVASSMHNPSNAMADDPLVVPQPEAVMVPPALPALQPIPLLPGLVEMLNALQANLMTSFTSQINHLLSRIDAQDELIKIWPQAVRKGKAAPAQPTLPPGTPTSLPGQDASSALLVPTKVLLVPDLLPVPHPPPTSSTPHPPHAILLDKMTWAGVVTPSNFAQNSLAKSTANTNANIIGRTPGGVPHKGRRANPTLVENTEIIIARGEGLRDKVAEDGLYKSNPGNIVQAAHSTMEHMSAQAPPSWVVPFSTILRFTKALVKPLGVGNPLPNKGWMFGQL